MNAANQRRPAPPHPVDAACRATPPRLWRHPRPFDVDGRCIGHADVRVDPRKAKRLAHHIRRCQRRDNGPRVVVTSALLRAACVGRWLRRWGWHHRVDPRLNELDFGTWDGRRWSDIGASAVDAWCADFLHHRPGGGESVATLLARCCAFLRPWSAEGPRQAHVVGHAGWISAAGWLSRAPTHGPAPSAAAWPMPVRYGARADLDPGHESRANEPAGEFITSQVCPTFDIPRQAAQAV